MTGRGGPAAASPSLFPLLAHLPPLPVCFAAALGFIVAAALIGLAGGSGHRLPWLPVDRRVRWRMWPGPGFARSRWALRRQYGLPRARRIARRGRASLSWRARRFGPWQEYASFAGWAHGWLFPFRVYTHLEQIRLVIAPPQKGKSAAAAGSIIDDRGPVVATSIRGDLIAATAGLRSRIGRIHVFNPEGAGRYGSTITWNPVAGCQDAAAATRRAGAMIEGASARGLDDANFWQDQAAMVLAPYLHAAALAGGSLRHVYRWILDEDDQPMRILAAHPAAADTAASLIQQYLTLPDRTRAGISIYMKRALRFMLDPQIAAMLCPAGPGTFDIAEFIRSYDTLYLVASDAKQSPVPPVFTLIIAEITWEARLASTAAGRLDPPVYLELDEFANIAPVPVAAWATWAAGSGVKMHIYTQSYAQLAERCGELGAETIWQACDVKLIYCGSGEHGLGPRVEQACGTVRLRGPDDVTYAPDGKARRRPTWTTEPVLPAAVMLQLPAGRAIVIQGHSKPVIVRTEQYWNRADIRRDPLAAAPALPAVARRVAPAPLPHLLASSPPPGPRDELAARRQAMRPAGTGQPARNPVPGGPRQPPWAEPPAEGESHAR
jgi:type IV secretion system protein VirD4